MSDQENKLNQKVEERFQEARNGMVELLDQIATTTVPPNSDITSLASANELFKIYGAALERVGVELPAYTNEAIANFEREVASAPEPEKTQAITTFSNRITDELASVMEEIKRNTPNLEI